MYKKGGVTMKYKENTNGDMKYSVLSGFGDDYELCTNSFAEAVAFAKANGMYVFDNELHKWIYDGYRDTV